MPDRTQASLDAFSVEADDVKPTDDDRGADPATDDREPWPSRWACPDCEFAAEYELHARVTPTCPRCLPGAFVRLERES